MNYFELHVGDYDAATAHLSMLEDAAYGRMIRIYYRTERPLPADTKAVCRLVRANSKPEREAVQAVLDEFFTLTEDGWRQSRCDEEIASFAASEPERAARKVNEETRLKRHREDRAELFRTLNDAGQHAPWNTKIEALRAMVAAIQGTDSNVTATPPATAADTPPATAPATTATATHGNVSPPPTTHYPLPKEEEGETRKRAPPCPDDVDAQVWSDWLQLRKAKKAPVTQTVLDGARTEASKAGMTLVSFLRVWCRRGSQGLEAAWLRPEERNSIPTDRKDRQLTTAALMTGARQRTIEVIDAIDAEPRALPAA